MELKNLLIQMYEGDLGEHRRKRAGMKLETKQHGKGDQTVYTTEIMPFSFLLYKLPAVSSRLGSRPF
jgi:hypothetical protein